MKNFFKFKPINFKKSDFCSDVAKEWSWAHIRRHFCYYPQLWLVLPIVAILAFAILYVICISFDFDVVPWRFGLSATFTSSFGYVLGMLSLANRKIEQEKLKEEEYQPTKKQKLISNVVAYTIGLGAIALLVYLEAEEIITDRKHILETIMTILTIIFAALPSALAKFIYR